MAVERPIPFWPAWSEEEAELRVQQWHRGEYPPVPMQEALGFADAECEAWLKQKIFPERHRRTFAKKTVKKPPQPEAVSDGG